MNNPKFRPRETPFDALPDCPVLNAAELLFGQLVRVQGVGMVWRGGLQKRHNGVFQGMLTNIRKPVNGDWAVHLMSMEGPDCYMKVYPRLAAVTIVEPVADMGQALTRLFKNRGDKFWGIGEDGRFLVQGWPATTCTGYARRVQYLLPNVKVRGRHLKEDEDTHLARSNTCDGHDFAVYDDRYAIDPWPSEVETIDHMPIVVPVDSPEFEAAYGPYRTWARL